MKYIKALTVLLATLLFSVCATAIEIADVDPSEIVAKYGKPDRVQSSEYEKPRPPLVVRMLEYKKQNVRFAFLANALVGSPPPYNSWKRIGIQDPRDNSVISAAEAERRMQSRARK